MGLLDRRHYEKVSSQLRHDAQVRRMREETARREQSARLEQKIAETFDEINSAIIDVNDARGDATLELWNVEYLAEVAQDLLSLIKEREA